VRQPLSCVGCQLYYNRFGKLKQRKPLRELDFTISSVHAVACHAISLSGVSHVTCIQLLARWIRGVFVSEENSNDVLFLIDLIQYFQDGDYSIDYSKSFGTKPKNIDKKGCSYSKIWWLTENMGTLSVPSQFFLTKYVRWKWTHGTIQVRIDMSLLSDPFSKKEKPCNCLCVPLPPNSMRVFRVDRFVNAFQSQFISIVLHGYCEKNNGFGQVLLHAVHMNFKIRAIMS